MPCESFKNWVATQLPSRPLVLLHVAGSPQNPSLHLSFMNITTVPVLFQQNRAACNTVRHRCSYGGWVLYKLPTTPGGSPPLPHASAARRSRPAPVCAAMAVDRTPSRPAAAWRSAPWGSVGSPFAPWGHARAPPPAARRRRRVADGCAKRAPAGGSPPPRSPACP